MKLGKMIVEYRNQRGLNQDALAKQIGIPGPRLSQIESGKQTGMSIGTALKLLTWLLK